MQYLNNQTGIIFSHLTIIQFQYFQEKINGYLCVDLFQILHYKFVLIDNYCEMPTPFLLT